MLANAGKTEHNKLDCMIRSSLRLDTLSRNAVEAGTVGRLAHERKVQQIRGAVNGMNTEFRDSWHPHSDRHQHRDEART